MDIKKLIAELSSSNKKSAASASADLASLIWSGQIDESILVSWLESADEALRVTASWAVWDLGRPARALETLMEAGQNDANDAVRLYCLRSWVDYCPDGASRTAKLLQFCNDRCCQINQRASEALKGEGADNS